MLKISVPNFDNYFNISDDFSKIEIKENFEKNNCFILEIGTTKFYKGFILLDNPKVKTICEIQFYKSKVLNKYIPRPTFKKVDKENSVVVRDSKKDLVIWFQ